FIGTPRNDVFSFPFIACRHCERQRSNLSSYIWFTVVNVGLLRHPDFHRDSSQWRVLFPIHCLPSLRVPAKQSLKLYLVPTVVNVGLLRHPDFHRDSSQ